jgi:hypothetical protein
MNRKKKPAAKTALCSHCFKIVNNLSRHLAQCRKIVIPQSNLPSNVDFMTKRINATAPSSSHSRARLITTDRTNVNQPMPSDLASALTGDSINTEGPFLSELRTQNRNIAVKGIINQMEEDEHNILPLARDADDLEMEVESEEEEADRLSNLGSEGDVTFAPGDAKDVPNETNISISNLHFSVNDSRFVLDSSPGMMSLLRIYNILDKTRVAHYLQDKLLQTIGEEIVENYFHPLLPELRRKAFLKEVCYRFKTPSPLLML